MTESMAEYSILDCALAIGRPSAKALRERRLAYREAIGRLGTRSTVGNMNSEPVAKTSCERPAIPCVRLPTNERHEHK